MRITIDTKTDSKEDIKQAIKLLTSLIDTNTTNNEEPQLMQEGIFGMFDNKEDEEQEEITKPQSFNIEPY